MKQTLLVASLLSTLLSFGQNQFTAEPIIEGNPNHYDNQGVFFDVDNDGDIDRVYPVNFSAPNGSGILLFPSKLICVKNAGGGVMESQKDIGYYENTLNVFGAINHADLNNDGFEDLIMAVQVPSAFSFNLVYLLNDGNGDFNTPQIILSNIDYLSSVETNDFDGNGELDILCYEESGNLTILSNSALIFTVEQTLNSSSKPLLWDEDMDGNLDILYTQELGGQTEFRVFYNTSNFQFSASQQIAIIGEVDVFVNTIVDEDFDGDLDVYYSSPSGISCLVNNSGVYNANNIISVQSTILSFEVFDFNQDNYPDIVFNTSSAPSLELYENTMGSNYSLNSTLNTPNTGLLQNSLYAVDLNGDGYLDVCTNSDFFMNYQGNSLNYSKKIHCSSGNNITFFDENEDGLMDLFSVDAYTQSINIFENQNGKYLSYQHKYTCTSELGLKAVTGDFNGDNVNDLLLTADIQPNSSIVQDVFFLEGLGNYNYASGVSVLNSNNFKQLTDYNEDGFMDILEIDTSLNNITLHLNDGQGVFQTTLSTNVIPNPYIENVKVIDLNNDQVLDIVGKNNNGTSIFYCLGSLSGIFSQAVNIAISGYVDGFQVCDYNYDTEPDLIYWTNDAMSYNSELFVKENNGALQFQANSTLLESWTDGNSIVDVNYNYFTADNTKDLAIVLYEDYYSGISKIEVLEQTTNGNYLAPVVIYDLDTSGTHPFLFSYDLKFQDLDGDGDVEFVWNEAIEGGGIVASINKGQGPYVSIEDDFSLDKNKMLSIAPNPFVNSAEVYLNNPAIKNAELTLISSSGKRLAIYSFKGQEKITIHNNALAPGVYFLVLKSEGVILDRQAMVKQ